MRLDPCPPMSANERSESADAPQSGGPWRCAQPNVAVTPGSRVIRAARTKTATGMVGNRLSERNKGGCGSPHRCGSPHTCGIRETDEEVRCWEKGLMSEQTMSRAEMLSRVEDFPWRAHELGHMLILGRENHRDHDSPLMQDPGGVSTSLSDIEAMLARERARREFGAGPYRPSRRQKPCE